MNPGAAACAVMSRQAEAGPRSPVVGRARPPRDRCHTRFTVPRWSPRTPTRKRRNRRPEASPSIRREPGRRRRSPSRANLTLARRATLERAIREAEESDVRENRRGPARLDVHRLDWLGTALDCAKAIKRRSSELHRFEARHGGPSDRVDGYGRGIGFPLRLSSARGTTRQAVSRRSAGELARGLPAQRVHADEGENRKQDYRQHLPEVVDPGDEGEPEQEEGRHNDIGRGRALAQMGREPPPHRGGVAARAREEPRGDESRARRRG